MDYRKNYFKIYFWQTISVLLGFAALFVVVPYISSNKTLYGIYSVCTSLTIFFSYADLGFLSSCVKYSAEYYIKGQHQQEVRIIGFTSFIMVAVFAALALIVVILGLFPKLLIPELIEGSYQIRTARWLLFTLAVSCPIIIAQRILSLVFTIRVEDYKYQRINIAGNIIRILSIFVFFGLGQYRIVEYYIFYQFVNLAVVCTALQYARSHYGYKIVDLLRSFRFDREVYNKVKHLTLTTLIMTLSAIIYYELDQVVISNIMGVEAVATYAAALSVLQFVRTFCSIVYSPYSSRYNHYIGLDDFAGLTRFVKKMIVFFAPILIVPILTLSLTAEPFVISWIGVQYIESGILVSFLVLSFIFNFIKDPIGAYFMATERNKILIKYNLLLPVVFWVGIAVLVGPLNTKAFAIMKFVAPVSNVLAYWVLASNDFKRRGYVFLSLVQLFKTVLPTVLIVVVSASTIKLWMIEEQSKQALLFNLLLMASSVIFSMIATIPFNYELRGEVIHYLILFKSKMFK